MIRPGARWLALTLGAALSAFGLLPVPSIARAAETAAQPPHATSPLSPLAGVREVRGGPAAVERLDLTTPVVINAYPGSSGFGYSAGGIGDVNGDGYGDIAVTTGTPGSHAYGLYLYYGSSAGTFPQIAWGLEDLATPFKVAATGDIDGDGYDDFVCGYGDSLNGGTGTIMVVYGGAGGPNVHRIFSTSDGGAFGFVVAGAGDVNGDGYADVLVGAPLAGCTGNARVYYGSSSGISASNYWSVDGVCGERFGISVAGLGDYDGDGFDDIAVGSQARGHYAPGTSPARIYYGSATGMDAASLRTLGLAEEQTLVGTLGDVNGDGLADLAVFDPDWDDPGEDSGLTAIFYGAPRSVAHPPGGYLQFGSPGYRIAQAMFTAGDVNGDGYADFLRLDEPGEAIVTLTCGGPVTARTGQSLGIFVGDPSTTGSASICSAGDVDADGYGDVVVGSPLANTNGQVTVFRGAAERMSVSPVATTVGGQATAVSGWSSALGDVNGDGLDDLLVGAPLEDIVGATDNGTVKLYLGTPAGISSTPVWTGVGLSNGANMGICVAAGQDINGDGYGDVVVGTHSQLPGGAINVWYGRADWSTALNFPNQLIYGPQANAYFGASVAMGDVDRDGFADVIVGAPYTDEVDPNTLATYLDVGEAVLFRGSPTGLVSTTWKASGLQPGAHEGNAVATGDVNGDGYMDVIVGAPDFDGSGGRTDAGRARVFLGGPFGPDTTEQARWTGTLANEHLGCAVAGAGDGNRDGYGDVAVGAYGYADSGAVFVFTGGPSGASTSVTQVLHTNQSGAAFGNSVAWAGDVDGDGHSDLVVGAVLYDGTGGIADGGRAEVRLGPFDNATPWFVTEGTSAFDNLGHCVAGGGDVNGDGFGDIAVSVPRLTVTQSQEGGVKVFLGSSAGVGSSVFLNRSHPAHLTRPGFAGSPIAEYGRSTSPTSVGMSSVMASAAGRCRVASHFRFAPLPGQGAEVAGSGPTYPLPDPASGYSTLLGSFLAGGLSVGQSYGWRLSTYSPSPYFRVGPWYSPQANGPLQSDMRTRTVTEDTPIASRPVGPLEMSRPSPNPTTSSASIEFVLPASSAAELSIRDVQGRLVRTLTHGVRTAGRHHLTWDGLDAAGHRAAAGLYFFDLDTAAGRQSQRIAVVR